MDIKFINFVMSNSSNYALVQEQILGEIQNHLGPHDYRSHTNSPVPGSINFTLFIRKAADVLMSHGAADKNYLFKKNEDGSRMVSAFNHVLVPGPWLRNRLLNAKSVELGPDQVHSVGWPRLDYLLQAQVRHVPLPGDGRLKVLWAPTHDFVRRGEGKVSTSSYPELMPFVPQLERECVFMTSLHPRNRKNKRPTAELLIEADVVISDFGTLVYEAWALGKPVIFPHWIIGQRIRDYLRDSAEAHIFENRIGLHADSFEEMVEMLRSRPVLDDGARKFLAEYLDPAYFGTSAKRVATLLGELYERLPKQPSAPLRKFG
jgi:hypothetical protein